MEDHEKLPKYIQVDSMREFSRLVCALERIPRVSFLHEYNGEKVISVQMDLLKERPIMYYAPLKVQGGYLSYGFSGGREDHSVVDSMNDNSRIYSPIIKIKMLPKCLKAGNGIGEMYNPIELEDLASLAKLSYGFEDAPFPLFLFPNGKRWLIGVFMMLSEEGSAYFCHVVLDAEPEGSFLKYATSNGTAPSFVSDPGEHGYSYIKVIKLKYAHPLVDYDQLQG